MRELVEVDDREVVRYCQLIAINGGPLPYTTLIIGIASESV